MNKIAFYIRLSVEDKIKIDESESITSQRMLLKDYVIGNDEFKGYEIEEYVDDGYSGSHTNRPSFERLLEDVKQGIIKIIIVKDLSRFMRDYILLGDYLENIFPFLGIRFIAINDGYDSAKEKGNGTDIDIQFKSLLYDFYSKEVSEKTKLVCNELKKQGKNISPPPFGYMKDPKNKYKLIIDEKTAWIVKRIFKLYLDKTPIEKIANILNTENIITASERRNEIYKRDSKKNYSWISSTVRSILKNENYTGTYVYNKMKVIVIGSNRSIPLPKEEWGRVYNNHEAIISVEDFEKVQEKFNKNIYKKDKIKTVKSILTGYIRCNKCNKKLTCIKRDVKIKSKKTNEHFYFYCKTCYKKNETRNSCIAKDIEKRVYEEIKKKISLSNKKVMSNDLDKIEKDIEKLKTKKLNAFEKYKISNISKEKFIDIKNKIDLDIKLLEEKMKINDTTNELKLTRELIEKYIDSVICKKSEVLKINWKER